MLLLVVSDACECPIYVHGCICVCLSEWLSLSLCVLCVCGYLCQCIHPCQCIHLITVCVDLFLCVSEYGWLSRVLADWKCCQSTQSKQSSWILWSFRHLDCTRWSVFVSLCNNSVWLAVCRSMGYIIQCVNSEFDFLFKCTENLVSSSLSTQCVSYFCVLSLLFHVNVSLCVSLSLSSRLSSVSWVRVYTDLSSLCVCLFLFCLSVTVCMPVG